MPATQKIVLGDGPDERQVEELKVERAIAAIKNPEVKEVVQAVIAYSRHQHKENSGRLDAISEQLGAGFPEGDAEGHRLYHQTIIDRRMLINQILRESLIHIAKYGALAGLVWLFYTLGHALKIELFK